MICSIMLRVDLRALQHSEFCILLVNNRNLFRRGAPHCRFLDFSMLEMKVSTFDIPSSVLVIRWSIYHFRCWACSNSDFRVSRFDAHDLISYFQALMQNLRCSILDVRFSMLDIRCSVSAIRSTIRVMFGTQCPIFGLRRSIVKARSDFCDFPDARGSSFDSRCSMCDGGGGAGSLVLNA